MARISKRIKELRAREQFSPTFKIERSDGYIHQVASIGDNGRLTFSNTSVSPEQARATAFWILEWYAGHTPPEPPSEDPGP